MVTELYQKVGEPPAISETRIAIMIPKGRQGFISLLSPAWSWDFVRGKLNQIHFFVQRHEGYSAYKADVLGRKA
ncbi:hypothetical protein SAMN03159473_02198 [Pseudomonas sp. NFACC52]|nr:hypothetical protein SAMN03159481_02977 [Pseudomonas sp. NFACC56-3]SFK47136.1 hypothetical protein SAMN03159473_02198 [Pseudomonas sp. NFACC52]